MDQTVVTIILDTQKELRQDIKEIDSKIQQILEWKWKLVGSTLVVSGALTIMFQIVVALISRGK